MNKLIIGGVIVFLVLMGGGFAFYNYGLNVNNDAAQQSAQENTENSDQATVLTGTPESEQNPDAAGTNVGVEVEATSTSPKGMLLVCIDKCGDGICQNVAACEEGDMNCVCTENKQECPADCK